MPRIPLLMPKMSMTMEFGTVEQWLVEVGGPVSDGDAVVVVTTDKVYRNREWAYPYREDDPLGGHDPYSASKAAAEIITASYRDAFLAAQGVAVATARAGNVIGGGDWAADRLLPDAVRAWSAGQTLHIRHPEATRPWQHVIEPLAAYLFTKSKGVRERVIKEVSAGGIHKGSGVAALCAALGIEQDEVIAFGDELNDVEMIAWAGHGVAMGNAADVAKDAADEIALTNDEDGVAVVLQRLLGL